MTVFFSDKRAANAIIADRPEFSLIGKSECEVVKSSGLCFIGADIHAERYLSVKYTDSRLAVSTWHWHNTDETLFVYSWDNNFSDDYYYGVCDIEYDNNQLVITEKDVDIDEEDGESEETDVVYLF